MSYPPQPFDELGLPPTTPPNGPADPTPPRKPVAGVVAGLMVGVLAIVAVATYFAAGHRNSAPQASPPAATGGPFGDLATLDPCSFFDAHSFADQSLTATDTNDHDMDVHLQPGGLDHCVISLELADITGGYLIDTQTESHIDSFGQSSGSADSGVTVTRRGSLRLAQRSAQVGALSACLRFVYDDNGTGVRIAAAPTGSIVDAKGAVLPGYDPCAIADDAANAVISAVAAHTVRHLQYPADSAGRTNLCAAATAADVDFALGTTGITLTTGSSPHNCVFSASGQSGVPGATLSSVLMTPQYWRDTMANTSGQGATAAVATIGGSVVGPSQAMVAAPTVAGRGAFMACGASGNGSGTGATTCQLWIAQRKWSPWPGRQVFGGSIQKQRRADADNVTNAGEAALTELLEVDVYLPAGTPIITARAAAYQIAAHVVMHLPQPS